MSLLKPYYAKSYAAFCTRKNGEMYAKKPLFPCFLEELQLLWCFFRFFGFVANERLYVAELPVGEF